MTDGRAGAHRRCGAACSPASYDSRLRLASICIVLPTVLSSTISGAHPLAPYLTPAEAALADQEALASYTSLDPEQLSVPPSNADDDDQRIRFSHWSEHREWLLSNLWRLIDSPRVRERVKACGRNAWVQYSKARHRVRVSSATCGNRLCPACRAKRAHILGLRIQAMMEEHKTSSLKLITLTLKHSKRDLLEQLKSLKEAFKKLRASATWKAATPVGVAIIEVTRSKETGDWHPHLHIIAAANYIPQPKLKAAWYKASKTSTIVDIRQIKGKQVVARYVSDYLTKPPDANVTASEELSKQWATAMQRTHWVIPFGKRGALPKLPPDEGPDDWTNIGRLTDLARASCPYLNPDFALAVLIESLNSQVIALVDADWTDEMAVDV